MAHPGGVSSNFGEQENSVNFSSSTTLSDGSVQAPQVDLEEIFDAVVELDEQLTDAGFQVGHMEPGL
jgi:hypothetical protein